jgi:hypothetical protein
MREASECLKRAAICDIMAGQARDAAGIRVLHDLADQWRRMASDTARYKGLVPPPGDEGDKAPRP